MKIRCFGIAKDITTTEALVIDSDAILTVSDLRKWLAHNYPAFANVKSFMVAVNQEYADDTLLISDQDEIAIIPPVAGG